MASASVRSHAWRLAGEAGVLGRLGRVRAWGAWCALALALSAGFAPCAAEEAARERLQVADPYIELHTGPGAGYPVTFVAARHEWIEIELRHTDWYKVRADGGQEGWVDRKQLETTLTESGSKKTFRDVLLDDYLKRRVEFGAAWGHFATDPYLKVYGSYNIVSVLALEAAVGQVQGKYSGTNVWQVDIIAQPWSDRRLEPFFGVGVGRINNIPNASLIGAISTSSNSANAMIGVRYHVSDRLIVRIDTAAYTAFISGGNTQQYRATTAGLSFFF